MENNIMLVVYPLMALFGLFLGVLIADKTHKKDDWERITRQMNARREFDRANLCKKLSMGK